MHEFDFGGGRVLRVWSIFADDWMEPHPRSVFYQIERGTTVLVPKTWLDCDDGSDYIFDTAFADRGQLSCVFEVTRARDESTYLLMFDAASGESWPDDRHPEHLEKWRGRYERLKRENPGLPTPEEFQPN
jgi:hypothetical protein